MLFYPKLDPLDFGFKGVEIPEIYRTGKSISLLKKLDFEGFLLLLNEAAENDDVETICKLWDASIYSSRYKQKNFKFPGTLLATGRILDIEADNGSEWHNLGVIQTKNFKYVFDIVEDFGINHQDYYDECNLNERLDVLEIISKWREDCDYREGEESGFKATYKIWFDMKKKVYQNL